MRGFSAHPKVEQCGGWVAWLKQPQRQLSHGFWGGGRGRGDGVVQDNKNRTIAGKDGEKEQKITVVAACIVVRVCVLP